MILLEGDLSNISLFNLLQFIKLEQKTSLLKITIKEINQEASMYFKNGHIIHAEVNTLKGIEAMFRIICWWNIGHFELKEISSSELPEATIEEPLESILIESAKRIDECNDYRKEVLSLTSALSFTQEAIDAIKKGQTTSMMPDFIKNLPKSFTVAKFFDVCNYNEQEACNIIKRLLKANILQTNIIVSSGVISKGALPVLESLTNIVMEFIGIEQSEQIVKEAAEELNLLNIEKEPGFAKLLELSDRIEKKLELYLDSDKVQEAAYRMRARITSLI